MDLLKRLNLLKIPFVSGAILSMSLLGIPNIQSVSSIFFPKKAEAQQKAPDSQDIYQSLRQIGSTGLYEITVGQLMQNPELFSRAYIFPYYKIHKEIVGDVKYKLTARFSHDSQNLVTDRFTMQFEYGGKDDEARERLNLLDSPEYFGISDLERKIRNSSVPDELKQKLEEELNHYHGWGIPGTRFVPVTLEGLNCRNLRGEQNNLDAHFAKFEERLHLDNEDKRLAISYMTDEARKRKINPREFSPIDAVKFLREVMRGNFRYNTTLTEDPRKLREMKATGTGNCVDFAYAVSGMFDLLKEGNKRLRNAHVIPCYVIRAEVENGRDVFEHHMINVIFSTSPEPQFTYYDTTFSVERDIREIKTFVYR